MVIQEKATIPNNVYESAQVFKGSLDQARSRRNLERQFFKPNLPIAPRNHNQT
eukprot:CAMPEP_0168608204 /NCGR_PEP_ID=MMETSP0449_2-20121227/496_1 /TAXON_ID=1082188 /ORGANISM="Strombidium rassoulzadegani, Strain ras09" /LENGTH=52 /DNA_ID=CAMNT_0008648161 /DNA_START=195 /DNA_END=353 /DNA_ORIENTATION=+